MLKRIERLCAFWRQTPWQGEIELIKTPLTQRRLILIIAVVILVLVLAFLLRDFVRQSILLPLIDMGWLVWVGLQTVPQIAFWGFFVLVALIIAIRSLAGAPAPSRTGYANRVVPPSTQYSRYHHWKVSMEALPNSPFARERLERELQGLVMQILADQARVDFEEIRVRQNHGELDLSAESQAIRDLFAIDHRKRFAFQPSGPPRWLAWLLRRRPAFPQPEAGHLDVPGIILWLEEQTGQRDRLAQEISESQKLSTPSP